MQKGEIPGCPTPDKELQATIDFREKELASPGDKTLKSLSNTKW